MNVVDSPSLHTFTPSQRALHRRAIAGALAAAPAMYFVGASLLKYGIGVDVFYDPIDAMTATRESQQVFNAVTPFVFIGGLVGAWALNVYPLVRWRAWRARGGMVGQLRVHLRPINLLVAATSAATLGALLLYLVMENLNHLRR
jgi:hypothetical protein